MLCLYCKRRIGVFRRLTDNEYCCTDHRVRMLTRSARALRDSRDVEFYDDEISAVFVKRIDGLGTAKKPQQQNSIASSMIFGLLLLGAVYVGTLGMSDGAGRASGSGANPLASFGDFRRLWRSQSAVRLTDDFKTTSAAWRPAYAGSGREWSYKDGLLRPGSLRIWSDTLRLTDYNVEFVGQIERRAMSWAYRATDGRNYYANKLVISKPGPLPAVDLVRYAVIDGVEQNRVRLPLPMNVRSDTLYKVQMAVRGSDFSTTINGQMVDTWSDTRLKSGGVGFFSEAGEVANLRYVTVTDRDTLVGRVLSYFGMIHPAMLAAR